MMMWGYLYIRTPEIEIGIEIIVVCLPLFSQ